MKIRFFFASALLVMVTYTNCSKEKRPTLSLNETESKLMGTWVVMTVTVEETGKPPVVTHINGAQCYFIRFRNHPYPISDGAFADAKSADDQRDCLNFLRAWKVGSDGRLQISTLHLISLDTVFEYADILILKKDTLAFRSTENSSPDRHTVYEFR